MRKSETLVAQQQANTRELLSRQPAHSVIIDLSQPWGSGGTGEKIADAIQNFFSIVCCLSGPCRISAFSLLASFRRTETFIPMQKVTKPLFSRLHLSLQEILSLSRAEPGADEFSSIEQACRESANNYYKFKELSNLSAQLEITIFTCKNSSYVKSFAGQVLRSLNLSDIKKVEFVCLTNSDDGDLSENISDSDIASQDAFTSGSHDLASMWNVVQLECDAVSMQCYFRQWLKDESTDKEHLRLQIGDVTIKCDTQERLLNPDELPFRASFHANGDLNCAMPQGSRGQAKAERLPILHFTALKVIPDDVVCESIIFGRPLVLVTSACWQMDWDELETNQGRFLALCKRLSNRNQCLLCENLTKQQGRQRNFSLNGITQPKGLFVIMPSKSSASLLLKSLSSRELLLPTRIESLCDDVAISGTAAETIDAAFEDVEEVSEFNPLEHESGLCESLKALLMPKTQNSIQRPLAKKPRVQPMSRYRFSR